MGRGGFEPPTLARWRVSPCKGDILTELDYRPEARATPMCNKALELFRGESDLTCLLGSTREEGFGRNPGEDHLREGQADSGFARQPDCGD